MSRIIEFEKFLFRLQRLEEEGKSTKSLQEATWKRIKEEIERSVDEQRSIKTK